MTVTFDLHIVPETASTMDDVRAGAERGAGQGYAVQALCMSSGRGRFGNVWSAPVGNLYLSFLLRPQCGPNQAAQIAFVVALAAYDAVASFDVQNITLKWPNDVLIDGRKCAGILLEQSLKPDGGVAYLNVGIGINVSAPPPERAGVVGASVDAVRDAFFVAFTRWYARWQGEGFAPVRDAWMAHAHGLNGPVRARTARQVREGIFRGLDADGALLMEADGAVTRITSAEIHFD